MLTLQGKFSFILFGLMIKLTSQNQHHRVESNRNISSDDDTDCKLTLSYFMYKLYKVAYKIKKIIAEGLK